MASLGFRERNDSSYVSVWETNMPGTWARERLPRGTEVVALQTDGSMTQVLYASGIGWVYNECVIEETDDERQEKEG